MSDENPFEAMMKAGQEWAKSMNPALEKFTAGDFEGMFPTMPKDMMEQFMGKGMNPEGLDAKTKLLLTLQGLTVQGAVAEAQIKLTVRHAIEAGATQTEVAETIALAGMFGGVPAMTKAMELANAVMKKDDAT
ncbi:carboxymuconolactone decarboxylase family protein [Octadecabacter sp. R77987]|uniref:carboxymuconolactone decarboxylase family protein n=1 Tax=Octadecabacter sp. R77987 TaxID=3093874 RepID=UPI00366C6CCD